MEYHEDTACYSKIIFSQCKACMSLPLSFFLAAIFGALLGLGRESSVDKEVEVTTGVRTFTLVSLMGAFAGVFYLRDSISAFLVVSLAVAVLIISYYIVSSFKSGQVGMTTEITLLYAFFIGFLTVTQFLSIQLIVALVVVALLILSLRNQARKLIVGVSSQETRSFISYAVVALVVLPFLPDTGFTLNNLPGVGDFLSGFTSSLGRFADLEIFNPRKLWFIVVLITGIDVVGYVLGRVLGNKKSYALTSFVGGFISSTSTTQSLAQKSASSSQVNGLVGAALIANLASFLQIFLLVGPLSPRLVIHMAPLIGSITLTAGVLAVYFLSRQEILRVPEEKIVEKEPERKIFSLSSALKFALLLTVIKFVTKVCLLLFGQAGFLGSSIIASFAGLDAILVNLAEIADKTITFKTALLTFVLVNATNLTSKVIYSFIQGSKPFALKLAGSFGAVVVVSIAVFLFL